MSELSFASVEALQVFHFMHLCNNMALGGYVCANS